MATTAVIVKVGGSLLDLPDLVPRLRRLFQSLPAPPLLLAGGGAAADAVRDWDRCFGLGEETAHALAMRSLSLTAELLALLWPQFPVCRTPADVRTATDARTGGILEAGPLVAAWTQTGDGTIPPLPACWAVTSDSIALWLAMQVHAEREPDNECRLLLAKSVDLTGVPRVASLTTDQLLSATDAAQIDTHFFGLAATRRDAARLAIDWVNLRCEHAPPSSGE